MANLPVEADSRVYVHADVSSPWDPTADDVDGCMILLDAGDPTEDDWGAADWTPGKVSTPRLLIGPGSPAGQFAPGTYWLKFRIHDDPEEPVLTSGLVVIT